jgi:hypothetical protein
MKIIYSTERSRYERKNFTSLEMINRIQKAGGILEKLLMQGSPPEAPTACIELEIDSAALIDLFIRKSRNDADLATRWLKERHDYLAVLLERQHRSGNQRGQRALGMLQDVLVWIESWHAPTQQQQLVSFLSQSSNKT